MCLRECLIFELLSVNRFSTGPVPGGEITTLDHETTQTIIQERIIWEVRRSLTILSPDEKNSRHNARAFPTFQRPFPRCTKHLERLLIQHGNRDRKYTILTEVLSGFRNEITVKGEDNASNRLAADGDVEEGYRSTWFRCHSGVSGGSSSC